VPHLTHCRKAAGRMTFRQFLRREYAERHYEWVNGAAVPMGGVTGERCEAYYFLLSLLLTFAEERDLGAVQSRPFLMKIGPRLPARAPDLQFIAKRNLKRLRKYYLDGPADLVVEVISPSSRTTDRVEKFQEYEADGVREYWLIDPERRKADFYRLGRDGRLRLVPVGKDSVFRSTAMIGLWLSVEWIWQGPTLLNVLREWKLV
jgi:Uma2 family endonuclease